MPSLALLSLFCWRRMDTFGMQHKEAKEEERLSYMLAKQSYLTPPITVPILLPSLEKFGRTRVRVT